jgi:hypothetical protein
MVNQRGGGSVGQSLRYVDPAAPEQSAPAGSDILKQQGLIVRPAIGGGKTRKRKGGFFPSVMAGVVDNGMLSIPLAGYVARKLMNHKSRKGGGKKAERWQAEREEAKLKLLEYGKPSAQNIQKYAVAKRRGSESAEEFLIEFRKKKQEKAEANEAKKRLKQRERNEKKAAKTREREEKKAAKQREREEKKAAKAATKKNKPVRKERTKKAKKETVVPKGTHLFFDNEGRVINKPKNEPFASLAKKVEAPAKTRKSPSNKSKRYFEELRRAREYLSTVGVPTGPNMSKYASMMIKGENANAWLENFKARRPLTMATKKARKAVKPKSPAEARPKPKTPNMPKPKTPEEAPPKTRKSPSNKSKRYFEELRKAREYLSTVGAPTGPNMSKYASMMIKGENASAWLENFKTRRPLGMATRKSRKPKTTAKAASAAAVKPKALTVVKEENENENENEI